MASIVRSTVRPICRFLDRRFLVPACCNVRWSSAQSQVAYSPLNEDIKKAFESIVGETNVSSAMAVREQHGKDESHHKCHAADLVVWPNDREQVCQVAKLCNDHCIPLIPFGSGTGLEGGVVAKKGGVSVDMTKMNEILEVNAEDFDVTVQAGVTRNQLNNYVRDTGLWFPVGMNITITTIPFNELVFIMDGSHLKKIAHPSQPCTYRRVVSLQSFGHFMASFLWSIRV
ncbi:hypothetical protein ACROYT_G011791 [Oculina patagonica]